MNADEKNRLMTLVADSKGYMRLPPRLAESHGASRATGSDAFGSDDRLYAIQHVMRGKNLGRMIDLGGHSGFFSLSLLDCGLAESSIVYDVDDKALEAGRLMAKALGLEDKVSFEKRGVDLDLVTSMPSYDTILSLNLVHHAGALYDVEKVQEIGWERYTEMTLAAMHKKCRTAVFGVGIKGSRPVNVGSDRKGLAARIEEMAARAGWKARYGANVQDIHDLGVEKANGAYKNKSFISALTSHLWSNASKRRTGSKRSSYYFYIFDHGRS